jgi:hypothetical protein
VETRKIQGPKLPGQSVHSCGYRVAKAPTAGMYAAVSRQSLVIWRWSNVEQPAKLDMANTALTSS